MKKLLLSIFLAAFALFTQISAQTVFRIASLNSTNPNMILSDAVTGDDGSAFALSSSSVFFTGDARTGRFNLTDLGGGAGLPQGSVRYTTLSSDLQTGKIYTLATSATEPITSNFAVTATHLIEINGASGAILGAVQLSQPIVIGRDNGTGFFAGFRRIVVSDGNYIYSVNPANGAVANLGERPIISPALSESDIRFWGVAEFDGTNNYLVYRRNGNDIVRTRVSDGVTTVVQSFTNLGEMRSSAYR